MHIENWNITNNDNIFSIFIIKKACMSLGWQHLLPVTELYNRFTIIKDIDLLKKTYFSTPELIGLIQLAILCPFFYNTYMYILVHPKRFDPCSIHPNHSWHTWGDSSWSIWCTVVNNSPPRAILFLVLHLFMNYDVY